MADEKDYTNIYKKAPVGISKSGSPYRAAIVDDSRTARQMLKQILLSVKFDVIDEIDNGSLAAMKIKNGALKPDYLFVDLEMPIMNGIELVREVRPLLPDCLIVMVTSRSEREEVEELLKLGINGYIKKPFDRDTVIEKITRLR